MLSSAYLLSVNGSSKNTMNPKDAKNFKRAVKDIVAFFIATLIIDILFIVWAVHCIIKCSHANGWSSYFTLILILLLFTPVLGFAVCIGVIVYCVASGCDKPKMAFEFY